MATLTIKTSLETGPRSCYRVSSKVNYKKIRSCGVTELVQLDEPDNARALSELGLVKLSLANYWLEQADEDVDEDEEEKEKEELTKEEQNAYNAIVEAKK